MSHFSMPGESRAEMVAPSSMAIEAPEKPKGRTAWQASPRRAVWLRLQSEWSSMSWSGHTRKPSGSASEKRRLAMGSKSL